jgi:hypothetical protein
LITSIRSLPRSQLSPEEKEIRNLRDVHNQMISRCTKPSHKKYPNYGGRGIKVCDRWTGKGGFQRFAEDMGSRPPGTQIDRIDNNGDYSPLNCRWATRTQQQSNTTRTRWVKMPDGRKRALPELARSFGIPRKLLQKRLDRGWEITKALKHGTETLSKTEAVDPGGTGAIVQCDGSRDP